MNSGGPGGGSGGPGGGSGGPGGGSGGPGGGSDGPGGGLGGPGGGSGGPRGSQKWLFPVGVYENTQQIKKKLSEAKQNIKNAELHWKTEGGPEFEVCQTSIFEPKSGCFQWGT